MPGSPKGFVWYELMTSDMDAAETFYQAVVGWGARAWEQPEPRYTLLTAAKSLWPD